MDKLLTIEGLISLLTLTVMEIVLGIDNVIFISILTGKLPKEHQNKARTIGLTLALIFRISLLFGITWLISLQKPLIVVGDLGLSGRDIILFAGGVFLVFKSISEIMERFHVEDDEMTVEIETKPLSVPSAIIQIILLDIVFSFDSILTAIGMSRQLPIMISAVIISVGIMLAFSGVISDFVNRQPTIRMLALAFLVLIGFLLIIESIHIEIHKSYVYVAMGFSLTVEILNLQAKRFQDEAERKKLERKNQKAEITKEATDVNLNTFE
jgi:predicted tellurium resistance membrane protein TerC